MSVTASPPLPAERLAHLHDFAVELAGWAARAIVTGRPAPAMADTKRDPADWVTPFDRSIERHTRAEIARRYPGHRVIGEEYGAGEAAGETPEITWYVDPIDGTTNFVHGLPWACFSLAGYDQRGVAVAVVADAYRGEVFSAVRGGGARLGGTPVRCAADSALAGSVLLTEWSAGRPWPGMHQLLDEVAEQFGATRIMGSCALALASVGAGRAAAALLPGRYSLWDVAAGALIAREGGAQIYGRSGIDAGVPGDGILAASPGLAEDVWRMWRACSGSSEGVRG